MKTTIKLAAFLVAASGVSSAASIVATNLVDMNFVTVSTLTPLNSSFTAKIGFLAEGTVLSPSSSFAQINAAWTNAGNLSFAAGDAVGYTGYFGGKVNFADSLGLAGKDVYIWVTNGSDMNAVLRSTAVDFLPDAAIPNENALGISAANVGTDFQILMGSYLANNPGNTAGGGSFVVGVPEPSALLLGALGAVGLIRRRR